MIKKSLFAVELAEEMQKNLQVNIKKTASVDSTDLGRAVDYLNNTIEIFEDAGLTSQANKVLNILYKLSESKRQKLPAIQTLLDAGVSEKDFKDFGGGSQFAKAKINRALLDAGFKEHEIGNFLGKHNVMPEHEINELLGAKSGLGRILKMIEDPEAAIPSSKLMPGDEIGIQSLAADHATQGLTSEKMVKNLLDHGTEFNMADVGAADDLLNLEVGEEGNLEVNEDSGGSAGGDIGFEDEV